MTEFFITTLICLFMILIRPRSGGVDPDWFDALLIFLALASIIAMALTNG